MVGKNLTSGQEIMEPANIPYAHARALIGNFNAATDLLNRIVKSLRSSQIIPPKILLHPLESVEGGLSQIEERVLLELGYGTGASKVKVYLGPDITHAELKNLI